MDTPPGADFFYIGHKKIANHGSFKLGRGRFFYSENWLTNFEPQ